jgi:hypothetical protein
MPRYNLQEDKNIYIDCNPVDTIGNEVDDDDTEESTSGTGSTFDSISNDLNSGEILNNLGLQFTIAITAFAIIYGIGNYVFKTIPGEMLEKRINSL